MHAQESLFGELFLTCAHGDATLPLDKKGEAWSTQAREAGWGFIFSCGGWQCPDHYEKAKAEYEQRRGK